MVDEVRLWCFELMVLCKLMRSVFGRVSTAYYITVLNLIQSYLTLLSCTLRYLTLFIPSLPNVVGEQLSQLSPVDAHTVSLKLHSWGK